MLKRIGMLNFVHFVLINSIKCKFNTINNCLQLFFKILFELEMSLKFESFEQIVLEKVVLNLLIQGSFISLS